MASKKLKIVILDSGYKSYSFEKQIFDEKNFELVIHQAYKGEKQEKMAFAAEADGILVRHTRIDEEFLTGVKNLKAVVRYGVGFDNVDVEACTHHGVKVANVQGYANHAVSDHALALMFSCTRALWDTNAQVSSRFAAPPAEDIFELHDKTLGIIGLGRIGTAFCRKASPLFREVLATDPYKPDAHFQNLSASGVSLDKLLEKSNVITIHCNLTDETRKLIGQTAFSKMKNRPVLINTSRGEVVDEKALLQALNSGTVHSAGLDVYENEPPAEAQLPLINHPRTICTGHYAWYSDYAALELQKRAALNLYNFLTGNPVEDWLNPEVL